MCEVVAVGAREAVAVVVGCGVWCHGLFGVVAGAGAEVCVVGGG